MKGKLPDAILNRKKSGLDIPEHEWFRGPLLPLLKDAIRPTVLFDADFIARLIDDHRNRRINAGYQLWGLLTLFLWMKRWNIEVSPDVVPDNLPTLHHKLDSL
jgi:asparagine synthase (glutamine-hydrolysing)